MEYKILVVLSNILFVYAGYLLGKDAGFKLALKAVDNVLERIVNDVNNNNSLDWLDKK